ncbi:MAG: hypothetical protein GF344_15760 [Chitinivibrionales bacterium]|nr:hypothetical protein [Chitinivibrionales bacterium]MBD3358157.1 hypothetical protein [Chitinivibrionales bacterium]
MKRVLFKLYVALCVLWMPANAVMVSGWGELGFLGVIDHKIQFSKDGTYFDYDDQGGQDVLFPFARLSIDLSLSERHTVVFLYQPLLIQTEVLLDENIRVDGLTFKRATPLKTKYSFPFYRISYLYDFMEKTNREAAIGVSLQIRNATISFATLDGKKFRSQRDIGPVPALKIRTRFPLQQKWWWGTEIDGMWAPVKYINGSDTDVVGAILDAALRGGYVVSEPLEMFASLRYLGGGAEGTGNDEGAGDGYAKNWLHFMTVSLGFHYFF